MPSPQFSWNFVARRSEPHTESRAKRESQPGRAARRVEGRDGNTRAAEGAMLGEYAFLKPEASARQSALGAARRSRKGMKNAD